MRNAAPADLLVTGFGPFPGVRVNPTTLLARNVAARLQSAGFAARALVLQTSYGEGLPRLAAEIASLKPRAVLMLGVAARARQVRVELFARGRASTLHPDATGRPGSARAVVASSAALPTRGRPQVALARLRRAGLVAGLSPSAGRYLCDASYAVALRHPALRGRPVLFVHVPWLRPRPGTRPAARVARFRPHPAALAVALAAIGRDLAVAGR